jgi:hypothetical protein
MSKKQRRNISQGTRVTQPSATAIPGATESTTNGSSGPSYSATTAGRSSATRRFTGAVEFKPDYSHVVSDVKRIGIIAASYLIILIVLSFILNR